MPFLRIYKGNQSIDLTKLIEEIKWSENDMEGPKSGRTLDAKMHLTKVACKRRCDIKLVDMETSAVNRIFRILRRQYFYCETDLCPGEDTITMEMYNSTRSGGVRIITTDNAIRQRDVAFNIIER